MGIEIERLQLLSAEMDLEPAEEVGAAGARRTPKRVPTEALCVSQAALPNGQHIKLLKTLLTSACERNCNYCPFRAGRDYRRATFSPADMAQTFMAIHRTGIVEGLFLSSGVVNGGVSTQDKLLDTADILRNRYGYRGYLHLKLMPGAEFDQVFRAMQLADRVSVNLEGPNTARLERLAPRKTFEELYQPLQWAEKIRRSYPRRLGWQGRWPSSTTQFVVGAVGESDLELLATTEKLYRQASLRRTYFSTFRPLRDTPFAELPAESPERELRLYQSSFLLRDYGFTLEDLPFDAGGQLPRHADPKRAWADQHLAASPVELNQAEREQLLRVPGIGPKSAAAILQARRRGGLNSIEDLRRIGVNPSPALPFILLDGRRPIQQLRLF